MKSNKPFPDLDLDRDLPTTPEDVAAQREHRPVVPEDWLDRLSELSDPSLFPEASRDRSTSEGWPPFEL